MTLSPEIRKLLQQTLKIRDSHVPLHRIIDILATEDGDVSQAVNRFRDVKNQELRRAFHNCALLLRELEREAGMKPAWETGTNKPASGAGSGSGGSGASQSSSGSKNSPASGAASVPKKPKFRPEELLDFEDDAMRGQVSMAKAYVDGASKGNPGEAGIGAVIFSMDGKKIGQLSRSIGVATNNFAEYTALIAAMEMADRLGVKTLFVLGDSELMVKQMTGVYKIKNPDILKKVQEAQKLKKKFAKFSISHIGREHNQLADALSTSKIPKKVAEPKSPAGNEGNGEPEYQDILPPLDETVDDGATE